MIRKAWAIVPSTVLVYGVLSACSTVPLPRTTVAVVEPAASARVDIALYALGLIDTGYRYGGKNPEAGVDCSGMVSHVYSQAAGIRLTGSAADMAKAGRPVAIDALRPGDLVFFNTLGPTYSHVGIYIGDDRFVHAPKSNAKVRMENMRSGYFASRFTGARSYLN